MKNINPKINPITTTLGTILMIVSLVMFISPMYIEVKEDINYWIPGSIGVIGLSLLLIPDDLKGALRTFISRKSNEV